CEKINSSIATGFTTFSTGMGMGVYIWSVQEVLHLRSANPALHLIAVEPYPGFSAKWSGEWQASYREVLQKADLVKRLNNTEQKMDRVFDLKRLSSVQKR
ncbi:MAG: DUF1273 family protein, partial [Clostridia bacterium]|nr:DUF1273 family protein [Clostridia bacterium]